MDTNTKYYTPAIEEFHVGFEYQVMSFKKELSEIYDINHLIEGDDFVWITRTWKELDEFKYSFSVSDFNGERKIIVPKSIRVKILDREDIESLGWIQRDYDTFDFGSNIAFEFIPEETSYIYTYGRGQDDNTIFKGKIKNKSELQRLMQQLNIE